MKMQKHLPIAEEIAEDIVEDIACNSYRSKYIYIIYIYVLECNNAGSNKSYLFRPSVASFDFELGT